MGAVFVTGASGTLGSAVVEHLLRLGQPASGCSWDRDAGSSRWLSAESPERQGPDEETKGHERDRHWK